MLISLDILFSIISIFLLGIFAFCNKNKVSNYNLVASSILLYSAFGLCFYNIPNFNFLCLEVIVNTKIQNAIIYFVGLLSCILIFLESDIFKKVKYEIYFLILLLSFCASQLSLICDNLISIYILLELQSIISAILISTVFKEKMSSQAGIKYIISSAIGSIIFLLGVSVIYLLNGTLDIKNIIHNVKINDIGMLLIIFGFFIKLGIFPFQIWFADIYSGCRISVINVINIIPKISIILVIYNILQIIHISNNLQNIIVYFLILGIIFATIRVVNQKQIKRIIAYSSAVNLGIVMLFLFIIKNEEFNNKLYFLNYYIISYVIANLLLCVSCIYLFLKSDKMEIDDQISNGNLFYLTTILSLLSLMGIPPMLGFFAKLKFISSLINDGNISSYIGIFAIFLSSVLGSYYYLKLPIKWILNSEKIEKNYNHINIAYNIAFILSLVLFFGFLAV